ncbi:MAG: hypothetical protein IJF49_03345 [Clostridia bacterium]|nr:hypothetical protein [Clostridia bacterium]
MIIISHISAYFPSTPKLLIIAGHYGAGKTNIALNLAYMLHDAGRDVTLIDLDIVNPYFRAADSEASLAAAGIHYINPPFANTNVDIPVLGADIQRVFPLLEQQENATVIFDVGGDNGAVALGRYHAQLTRLGAMMLCVENAYRPLTETPEAMLENLREIEGYSRLRFDAIINNTNLGEATTAEDIIDKMPAMQQFASLAALPILFTTVCAPLDTKNQAFSTLDTPLLSIRNHTRKIF